MKMSNGVTLVYFIFLLTIKIVDKKIKYRLWRAYVLWSEKLCRHAFFTKKKLETEVIDMSNMMVNNHFSSTSYAAINNSKTKKVETSFPAQVEKSASKKSYTSATEDYKKRHPEDAALVDGQILAGKNLLKQNGAENINRDSMTMGEYKKFFSNLMNSIPYDWSQKNDVNVWSITEAGWEQMKNDTDYEAWVLGYTVIDRSVNMPYASMPGYSPTLHIERFGASIDEHLGQGMPMNNSNPRKVSDNEESWWEKRKKRFKELLKQQEEKAHKESIIRKKEQEEEWKKVQFENHIKLKNFLNGNIIEMQSDKVPKS